MKNVKTFKDFINEDLSPTGSYQDQNGTEELIVQGDDTYFDRMRALLDRANILYCQYIGDNPDEWNIATAEIALDCLLEIEGDDDLEDAAADLADEIEALQDEKDEEDENERLDREELELEKEENEEDENEEDENPLEDENEEDPENLVQPVGEAALDYLIEVRKNGRYFFVAEFEGIPELTWMKTNAKTFRTEEEAEFYAKKLENSLLWFSGTKNYEIKNYSDAKNH